jgi:hypothetical protein
MSIHSGAFSNNQLTNLTIGSRVFIADDAFSGNRLTSLNLGANNNFNVSVFGFSVYYDYNCNDRRAGTYNTGDYASRNDGDYTFIETRYGVVITGYRGSGGNRLIIPGEMNGKPIKGIGDSAFQNKNIGRMQLPDGLVFIGISAFRNNQLTNVTIPNGVSIIGGGAFRENQLINITIPDSVSNIGAGAFGQQTNVTFAGNKRVVTIEMWDSANDGWDGSGALWIMVNGADALINAKAIGSGSKDFLFVETGDEVVFYWIAGSSQGENAFAVYYSDNQPTPAFNPRSGAIDSRRVLLYRHYGGLSSATYGERLGSFTVP